VLNGVAAIFFFGRCALHRSPRKALAVARQPLLVAGVRGGDVRNPRWRHQTVQPRRRAAHGRGSSGSHGGSEILTRTNIATTLPARLFALFFGLESCWVVWPLRFARQVSGIFFCRKKVYSVIGISFLALMGNM